MYVLKNRVFALSSVILFVSVFGFSCKTTPPEKQIPEQEFKSEAVENTLTFAEKLSILLNAGEIDAALALFDELSQQEAEKPENQIMKASILISADRLDNAREIANALIAEDSTNMEARFLLSNIEAAYGKQKEQKNILEGIIKENPVYVPALNALGEITTKGNYFKIPASYYDRALAAAPSNRDALCGRANIYRLEHKFEESENLLNKAVTLYPSDPVPLSERGRLYRENGKYKEALADLEKAENLSPQNYWIAYDRGRIYLDMNKRKEALAEFVKAEKINPNNFIAYVYSAGLRDEMGDVDGAENDYKQLIKLRPGYYFAFEGLGIQKMKKKQWQEAYDAFKMAYNSAPAETNYAILAAINALRSGQKPNEIRQFVEKAMQKIDRSKIEYYVVRLFYDFSSDSDVVRRVDKEKNERIKAQMLFYLASYYDIKGNNILADKFYIEFRDSKRMDLIEWRINEWIMQDRNIFAGKTSNE